jgi:hypothetical protein
MPIIIRIPHGRRSKAREAVLAPAPPRLVRRASLNNHAGDQASDIPVSTPLVAVPVFAHVRNPEAEGPVAAASIDSLPRAVDTLAGVPDAVVVRKPPPRPAATPLSSAHQTAEGDGRGCIEGSPRPDTRPSGETGATGPVGADLAATHVSLRRARLHHERVLRGEACRVESFAALQRARVEWRVVRCV